MSFIIPCLPFLIIKTCFIRLMETFDKITSANIKILHHNAELMTTTFNRSSSKKKLYQELEDVQGS